MCCAAAAILAACARETPPVSDTTAVAPGTHSAQISADTACPKSGAWRPCNVLDRLEAAGLVVKQESNPVQFPFFSVTGTMYSTSRATVHVFLYPDAIARRRDTDQLDSAAVAPRHGSYTWSDPAVLVTSNNLAAVVVSPNERQTERIVLALSAGLPR